MDTITTRRAAKAAGLKHYFTGKPCSRGHIAKRHLTGTCVECQQIANSGWAARNPGEASRRSAKWVAENRSRANANSLRSKRKAMNIPDAPYGLPTRCECCGKPLTAGKRVHIDHDHITGKFRGWLCNRCNLSIGQLGDDLVGVLRAAVYLTRPDTAQVHVPDSSCATRLLSLLVDRLSAPDPPAPT